MQNGISVYKMPRYEQRLSTERNNTLYKYKRSKKDRKISAHSKVSMDKLSASNAKNKSACYAYDCHLDEWLLGSQHIHQLCTRTDLNEHHITLHTEHIQSMTGKDSLGGLSE
jgi:hypothetical protein